MAKLTRMDVQRAVNLLPDHLAPSTKAQSVQVLRSILRQAVIWDILPRDLSLGVKGPRIPRREMCFWMVEEAARFLETAREGGAARHGRYGHPGTTRFSTPRSPRGCAMGSCWA